MYGKLFASLYQGTLRGRSNEILVFSNMIAFADREGFVDKHWRAIAEEVGLTVEQVKTACENLEAPDIESRTPDADGARIVRVDEHRAWGWKITNYAKYRAIKCEEDRRIQNREAKRRQREKKPDVSIGQQESSLSAHAEAEAENIHTHSARTREGPGDPAAEPVIPTLEELLPVAALRGVPEAYARDYWARNNEQHRWIKNGHLMDWASEMHRFWSKDRFKQNGTAVKQPRKKLTKDNFDD